MLLAGLVAMVVVVSAVARAGVLAALVVIDVATAVTCLAGPRLLLVLRVIDVSGRCRLLTYAQASN